MHSSATVMLLMLCCAFQTATGQSESAASPQPGDMAPSLELEDLFQTHHETISWDDLRGNVVVLEFWATWCGPCVAAIPHINELRAEFADRDVVFLAISNESRETVEKWLDEKRSTEASKKLVIESWIGIDSDSSMFNAYDVQAIPRTVVVDGYGRIASITHPTRLTRERMEEFLRGHRDLPSNLASADDEDTPDSGIDFGSIRAGIDPYSRHESPPQAQIIFRTSTGEHSMMATGGQGTTCLGSSLPVIIRHAWRRESYEIDLSALEPLTGRYDFILSAVAPLDARMYEAARELIRISEKLVEREEQRTITAYELGVGPDGHHLDEGMGMGLGVTFSGKSMKSDSTNIRSLMQFLEVTLGGPVRDETGLDGFFAINLTLESDDPETVARTLREEFGLELTPVEREVDVLVFERASEPATESAS